MPWSNDGGNGPRASGPWGGGGGNRGNGGGGGPWGGGGGGGGPRGPGGGPGGGGQGPKIDDFFKKGQKQLKGVFGEGGGFAVLIALLVAAAAWIYVSVFTVEQNERAVILTFGEFSDEVGPGLNFAPWPVQTAEVRQVTIENTVRIGGQAPARPRGVSGDGIMLTGDENIIDISFEVVWVIDDLQLFLFNLAEPDETIRAVAISAMREIVGRSRLTPLLNEDRDELVADVEDLIQATMDSYNSGVRIVRVTLDRADPPPEVVDDFRAVQAAEQQRETLLQRAEQYYKETTARARGEAAQIRERSEAYYAEQVAAAEGEAARFNSVLVAYQGAPEITRRRLYIDTMQRILGGANKIFIDSDEGGTGILPYLPLDRFGLGRTQ